MPMDEYFVKRNVSLIFGAKIMIIIYIYIYMYNRGWNFLHEKGVLCYLQMLFWDVFCKKKEVVRVNL